MIKLEEKNYHRFTAEERINLTIAALSRKDDEEVSRLRRTCPKKHYIMLDRDYTSKLENLPWIASQFSELQNLYYHNMILFIGSMGSLNKADQINRHLAFIDQVASVKSLYAAFSAFCDDIGLNKNHLMEWLKIDPRFIHEFIGEKMMSAVEPDNDLALHIKNKFLSVWNYT